MRLDRLLGNLGYGSRKDVRRLLKAGRVTRPDGTVAPAAGTDDGGVYLLDGEPLDPRAPLTLLLHKPVGVTCSSRDPGATVYSLLPRRFSARRPVMSTVGRLDKETSGLILLTDDGALLHRIASPKKRVAKVYVADVARPLADGAEALLEVGRLVLEGERTPCHPARLERLSPLRVRLTITEGRYHIVRRMIAALGSHVETLHREQVGGLALPEDLAAGAWREATADEVAAASSRDDWVPPTP